MLLFAITGASIDWSLLQAGATAGALLVAARIAGKAVGVLALARPASLPLRKASLLALTLTPMSAVAIVLAQETAALHPTFGPTLMPIVMSAIAVLELARAISPLAP